MTQGCLTRLKQVRMYCNVKLPYMNVLLCLFVPMFCMYFNISIELDLDFNLCWIIRHKCPEQLNSFSEGSSDQIYIKVTPRHSRKREYWSPNQTCPVLGFFHHQNWLTLRHVSGHMPRATWLLRVPCDSPWAVDDFRHWNFSICSKNMGVMTVLVEEC